ncbi:hypothetical protein A7P53_11245 [Acinetobacter defluvii]|uniref:hypothetical protein n=1 Tax=Acinetobacter defluvii TaxID=1871111 RepID=UPI0014903514|nr:hypothetical protein [Acinetobacter defluvii]NNP73139.1 hypothetical protein [Acinetobacter defluvii]
MNTTIKNTQRYNFLSAFFAFLLWGSWSFYINMSQGSLKAGIISGLAQGICSFMITLVITHLIEKQFNFYQVKFLKLLLPPICTILFTGSILVLVHHLIQTPNILKTVTPALTVAFIFAFVTNLKLYKQYQSVEL